MSELAIDALASVCAFCVIEARIARRHGIGGFPPEPPAVDPADVIVAGTPACEEHAEVYLFNLDKVMVVSGGMPVLSDRRANDRVERLRQRPDWKRWGEL